MIFTADWCFYNAQATKQGFWEITPEALETYAPMTAESMYPEAWEQAKVDGKVYMLPMNYQELTAYVWMARGDLMDKYGIESLDTFEGAEQYMQAIVDNEPSMIPLDVGSDYDVSSCSTSSGTWSPTPRATPAMPFCLPPTSSPA